MTDTLVPVLAVVLVVACALVTVRDAESFEAANERPVYWRTA